MERQAGETWGRSVVHNLAKDLQLEFPGIAGFSAPNLYKIRKFYESYRGNEILSPLVIEISWTKNLVILEQCKDSAEREFYLRRTKQFGWTKNVLIHQIENRSYEKTAANQTNFDIALPEHIRNQAKLAVKDEYTFDFLELADEHSEHHLSRRYSPKSNPSFWKWAACFLSSVASTGWRLATRNISLTCSSFHRRLKSLIAVELKIGEFEPEHIGKMQFYLALLDDTARLEGENPAIGVLISKSKDRTIVEYALRESSKPIGVAAYRILSSVPDELRNDLPAPEQIAKLLEK